MVLRPGDTLRGGQYEIITVLGQGGFGITYKALDHHLKRYVVLKSQNEYLQHDPDYEKYVERFMKEGQIMAQLPSHPNLVKVFALFSEPANHHYLMMEFIEGQNLFEAVKARGRLPETEVISIAKQIGSALEWMHNHQLVHRDVHPGNIMLCFDGKAVLIDLGGAKEFVASPNTSEGTYHQIFSPCEQIDYPKDTRHPSADIFSLAGSLYFAATGKYPAQPFARRSTGGRLIPPGQLVEISEGLDAMLMAGLELEAANRPQSIQELLIYLENTQKLSETKSKNSEDYLDWTEFVCLLVCSISFALLGIGASVQLSISDEIGSVFGIVLGEQSIDALKNMISFGKHSDVSEALKLVYSEYSSWKWISSLIVVTAIAQLLEISFLAEVGSCIVAIAGAYLVSGVTAGIVAAIVSVFLLAFEFNQTTLLGSDRITSVVICLGLVFISGSLAVLNHGSWNGLWGFGSEENFFDTITSGLWWGSIYFSNQILRSSLDLTKKRLSNRSKISLTIEMTAVTFLTLMSLHAGNLLYNFRFPNN
jgi:serine/threonine protein kinase